MWRTGQTLDIEALRRTVEDYRSRVYNGPANMRARIDLAWYLLLLAVHEAGREGDQAVAPSPAPAPGRRQSDRPDDSGSASQALLRESARQAAIVAQLSSDPQTRGQAANLKAIAKTVNAEWAIREAEREAARALTDISRAILTPERGTGPAPGEQSH